MPPSRMPKRPTTRGSFGNSAHPFDKRDINERLVVAAVDSYPRVLLKLSDSDVRHAMSYMLPKDLGARCEGVLEEQ